MAPPMISAYGTAAFQLPRAVPRSHHAISPLMAIASAVKKYFCQPPRRSGN